MTHYGITGVSTVTALAKALKVDDDHAQLEAAVKDVRVAGGGIEMHLKGPRSSSNTDKGHDAGS